MRARTGVLASALALLALSVLPATAQDDPGLLDAARTDTRYAPYEEVWWSVGLGGSSFLDASPVLAGDKVVVADWSGAVVALDVLTGKEAWRHEMGARVSSDPAAALGRVFVADTQGDLVALDADTGTVLGTATVGPTRAPVVFHEGKLFVGNEAGEMVAFTATDLDQLWRFSIDSVKPTYTPGNGTVAATCTGTAHPDRPIRTAAAVHAGVVVFGAMNHYVYAIDEMGEPDGTTTVQWIHQTGDIVLADPVIDPGKDRVLVAGYDEALRSLPLRPSSIGANACFGTTNLPSWSTTVTGSVTETKIHSRPVLEDGVVYFGGINGRVHAYDALKGTRIWYNGTDGPVLSDPAVHNGVVVVGSDDGHVYWFDAANGTRLARFDAGSPVKTAPAVAGANTFVATETGTVYRLGGPPPSQPDLVLTGLKQTPAGIQVTVRNDGTGASEPTEVRIEHNGSVQGTLPVPALQAGASMDLELPFTVPPGLQIVTATVDAAGTLKEKDESNNGLEGSLFGIDEATLEEAAVARKGGGGLGGLGWSLLVGGVVLLGGGGGFAWWWFWGRYEWVDADDEDVDDEDWD